MTNAGHSAIETPDHRIPVRLLSIDGRDLVTVRLPPMTPWPEVVHWGQRIFVINDRTNPDPYFVPFYREGIVWVVMTDNEGRQLY